MPAGEEVTIGSRWRHGELVYEIRALTPIEPGCPAWGARQLVPAAAVSEDPHPLDWVPDTGLAATGLRSRTTISRRPPRRRAESLGVAPITGANDQPRHGFGLFAEASPAGPCDEQLVEASQPVAVRYLRERFDSCPGARLR